MYTGGLFNTTLGIHQLRFTFRQQACYLFQDSVQKLIFRHRLDDFAFAEDHAASLATGKTHVGITRFARAVDHAAHYSYMNGSLYLCKTLFDFVGNAYHVDFDTPTGGTGDEGDTAVAQFERTQNFVCDGNLFLRLGAQADTDGIADAVSQQQTETHG